MPKIKILDLDRTIETDEGTSILDACLDHDIEIDHDIRGRPIVFIRNIKSSIKVDLSISHSSNYALAVCIVYNSL